MDVLRLRGLRDDAVERCGGDEVGFAGVPGGEDGGGGSAAEDAGVDEPGEADVREVAGGAEDAFEVPDCFGAVGLAGSQLGGLGGFGKGEGGRCYAFG